MDTGSDQTQLDLFSALVILLVLLLPNQMIVTAIGRPQSRAAVGESGTAPLSIQYSLRIPFCGASTPPSTGALGLAWPIGALRSDTTMDVTISGVGRCSVPLPMQDGTWTRRFPGRGVLTVVTRIEDAPPSAPIASLLTPDAGVRKVFSAVTAMAAIDVTFTLEASFGGQDGGIGLDCRIDSEATMGDLGIALANAVETSYATIFAGASIASASTSPADLRAVARLGLHQCSRRRETTTCWVANVGAGGEFLLRVPNLGPLTDDTLRARREAFLEEVVAAAAALGLPSPTAFYAPGDAATAPVRHIFLVSQDHAGAMLGLFDESELAAQVTATTDSSEVVESVAGIMPAGPRGTSLGLRMRRDAARALRFKLEGAPGSGLAACVHDATAYLSGSSADVWIPGAGRTTPSFAVGTHDSSSPRWGLGVLIFEEGALPLSWVLTGSSTQELVEIFIRRTSNSCSAESFTLTITSAAPMRSFDRTMTTAPAALRLGTKARIEARAADRATVSLTNEIALN